MELDSRHTSYHSFQNRTLLMTVKILFPNPALMLSRPRIVFPKQKPESRHRDRANEVPMPVNNVTETAC